MKASGAASDATLGAVVRLMGDEVCSDPSATSCLITTPRTASFRSGASKQLVSWRTDRATEHWEKTPLQVSPVGSLPHRCWCGCLNGAPTATCSQGIPHTWELVGTP